MSKRVRDWNHQDVMVWLSKNMNKLNSAESLRVYVDMQKIDGATMLGYKKTDCTRFGLIKPNDFDKILVKLRSYDEKLEKEERKTMGKTKKKKGFWQTDKDSGLDEFDNSSVGDEAGPGYRKIQVNSDSPGSANTSGTGSFAPSLSGGSTHKTNASMVQPATYEWQQQPGRPCVEEAMYIAPEEIHRTSSGTYERVPTSETQGNLSCAMSRDNAVSNITDPDDAYLLMENKSDQDYMNINISPDICPDEDVFDGPFIRSRSNALPRAAVCPIKRRQNVCPVSPTPRFKVPSSPIRLRLSSPTSPTRPTTSIQPGGAAASPFQNTMSSWRQMTVPSPTRSRRHTSPQIQCPPTDDKHDPLGTRHHPNRDKHKPGTDVFFYFSYTLLRPFPPSDFPLISEKLQLDAAPASKRDPLPPPPHLCDDSDTYVNLPRSGSERVLPSEVTKPPRALSRGQSEITPKLGYIHLDDCESQPAPSDNRLSMPINFLSTATAEKSKHQGYVNIPRISDQPRQPGAGSFEWVRPPSFEGEEISQFGRRRSYENIGRRGSGSVVPAGNSPMTDTYVDPISLLRHDAIPRSGSLGSATSGRAQNTVTHDNRTGVPPLDQEAPHRPDTANDWYMLPDEVEPTAPTRPVPMFPPLPDPDFGEEPDALYENFEPPPPQPLPPPADEADEWDEEQTYLNLEEAEEEPEDMYMNQEAEPSSSEEEESSDEEGQQDNLAEIQRRLTLAMGIPGKAESVPSRPPIQPPAPGFGSSPFARRPIDPPVPAAPPTAKPATPSRDVTTPSRDVTTTSHDVTAPSRDVPPGPPPLSEKPKHNFQDKMPDKRVSVAGGAASLRPPVPPVVRQNTSPSLPSSPPAAQTGGGLSIKERMAMLNADKTKDEPTPSGAGFSIKDRQSKIAGIFGGAPPPAAPPSRLPVSSTPTPPSSTRPISPPVVTRNPPLPGGLPPQMGPPKRPSPQPPAPAGDLPPPPPPLSCLPRSDPPPPIPSSKSNTNMSKGCYEDNEIQFPPPAAQGRSPMLPPSFKSPQFGSGAGYNAAEEDDEGLYALEPDEPDDIYNDGDEECIPGHLHYITSRQHAEEILLNDPRPECYLIRNSTNNPEQYPYVISLKEHNSFEHTRLGSRHNGRLAIGSVKQGETTHASLAELIRYHTNTPLNLRGRNVLLRFPVTS